MSPPPDGTLTKSKTTAPEASPETAAKTAVSEEDRVEIVRLVAKAWEGAGVDVNCELCGYTDWSLVATESADGLAVPLRRGPSVELGQCFLAYALQCRRCGNLRMFGKQRIEELAASADD